MRTKPFLYYVAKDLITRYGYNLSNVTIVFPGKRAQLYMNSFLSHIAQGPVWAPRFTTISELFQQFSNLTPSDNIINVCRLYKIYAELTPEPESLDKFYGWGEILINDFNDIDKHMVSAEQLFTNVADLAELDDLRYLTKEQIEALKHFFSNFEPERQTEIKRRFMAMWKIMPQMYSRLKDELRKEGLMYNGGLYREVAERINNKEIEFKDDVYCFVGFNVLDEVEKALFSALRDADKALYYWDYDKFYASQESSHEAGYFIRQNLKDFPQVLSDDIFDNLFDKDKEITFLSTNSDNAQTRFLPQWLEKRKEQLDFNTAIILCDETMTRAVLHAIPEGIENNVTMGFPLNDTAIQGYFSALIDLQVDGYDQGLKRFRPTPLERLQKNPFFAHFPQALLPLQHYDENLPLIDWLIQAIEALAATLEEPLYIEAAFQLYRILNQFRWLVTDGTLNVQPETLRRLIRQSMSSASIPFHGEMDEGVQIMGLLEARNLDFTHLIMLSVGEGIIPRRSNDASLIPYILRAHFGLDTTERQDAVYAYSFYRLLQRAQDITLVYNANSSGTSQREQSRFLRQLLVETPLHIKQMVSENGTPTFPTPLASIEKDERTMEILQAKRSLSPTAINQYITCPLRFYYQQVANLRMPDRPQDGIDNARLGTIFHDTCEIIYKHLRHLTGRKQVLRSDFDQLFTPLLNAYLDLIFWVDYFQGVEYDSYNHPKEREAFMTPFEQCSSREELGRKVSMLYDGNVESHFTGVNMIIRDVILQLVRKTLRWDMEHTPFTMYEMEHSHYIQFTIPSGEKNIKISIGGRIDRMDIMHVNGQEALRVVDYKTGREKDKPTTMENVFVDNPKNSHAYYMQTLLYSLIMSREQQLPVVPCLFYVLSATDTEQYNPQLFLGTRPINDIRDIADEYTAVLQRVLEEIYNPELPFLPTAHKKDNCQYCDFRRLCGRTNE